MIKASSSLDEYENLSGRTKAGVARARDEGNNIGRPFREINGRKVDEHRARELSWSAVSISRVIDIPRSTQFAAKARRAERVKLSSNKSFK